MWTEKTFIRIEGIIRDACTAALNQGNWARLEQLSQAQKLLGTRKQPHVDLAVLMAKVQELAGEDLLAPVLTEQGLDEASPQPQVEASHQPPGPGGEDVSSWVPLGKLLSESHPTRVRTSEEERRLAELLIELRTWLQKEPADFDEISHYEGRLQRLRDAIEELEPTSQEASRAQEKLSILREIRGYYERLVSLQVEIQAASTKKDLFEAKRVEQTLKALPGFERDEAGEYREGKIRTYARAFPVLTSKLFDKFGQVQKEIGSRLTEIDYEFRKFVTRFQVGTKEELEGALDDLLEYERLGIARVPHPARPEELIDRGIAIADTKKRLLDLCLAEARRLYKEAEEQWKHYNDSAGRADCVEEEGYLRIALERCNTGLNFAVSKHLDHKELREEKEKLESLKAKVTREQKNRQEREAQARKWYDRALASRDVIEQLDAYLNAAETFPCLAGLTDILSTQRRRVAYFLSQQAHELVQEIDQLRIERAYDQIEAKIALFRQKISALADDLSLPIGQIPAYGEEPQPGRVETVKDLRAWLSNYGTYIRQEKIAWTRFQERIRHIEQLEPKTNALGDLDENWLRDLERDFHPDDLRRFAKEWDQAKSTLARKAGALTAYRLAKEKFERDSLDPEIEGLLAGLGKEDANYDDAQRMLRLHRAYVHLNRAKARLRYPTKETPEGGVAGLTKAPDQWRQEVTAALQEITPALSDLSADLQREVEIVKTVADTLYRLQRQLHDLIGSQQFKKAFHKLEDYEERDADALLLEGLRWLRMDLRRQWRAARLDYIRTFALQDIATGCQPASSTSAEALKRSLDYLQELEQHGFTEDGDGPLRNCLLRLWHQQAIRDLLGKDLAALSDAEWPTLLARRREGWKDLFDHLQGLLRLGEGLDAREREIAEKVRALALGRYALDASRRNALEFLQEARSKHEELSEDPLVCSLLVLRYMDSPEGLEQARKVVEGLRGGNRLSQRLAEALGLVVDAHGYQRDGDLEIAVDTFNVGIERLKELMPDFVAVLDEAAHETKAQWNKALGEKLLSEALDMERQLSREKAQRSGYTPVFRALHTARRAQTLLPGRDNRVEGLVSRLLERADKVYDQLHEDVTKWLETPPQRLEKAIQQGRELEGYIKEVLGPEYRPGDPRSLTGRRSTSAGDGDQRFQAQVQDLEAVQAQLAVWETAQREVERVHKRLREVLEGNWRWNTDPRATPKRELYEVRRGLREKVEPAFVTELPPEVEALRRFIEAFDEAVEEIAPLFEQFRESFEGDTYKSERDLTTAKAQLQGLGQMMAARERTLRELASQAELQGVRVVLDPFFLVRDLYGRPRSWGESWVESASEDIKSLDQARERLEDRLRSWQEWQNWTQKTLECQARLQNSLAKARKAAQPQGRKLGLACRMLGDADLPPGNEHIPALIADLERQLRTIPEPPMCQLAYRAARHPDNESVYEPDREANEDLWRAWERVRQATSRLGVRDAWKEYLALQIRQAKKQVEDLRGLCDRRAEELKRLINEMNDHVRHHRKPSSKSEETYAELLEKAEAIDEEDTEVKGHRTRFEGRQRLMKG